MAQGVSDKGAEMIQLRSDDEHPTSFQISKKCAKLSKFVEAELQFDEEAGSFKVIRVSAEILAHVIEYLKHHKGVEPESAYYSVRFRHMNQIVSDEWDGM